MSKTRRIVSMVAIVAVLSALVAMPVLAAEPEAPVTLWQRLQLWFHLAGNSPDAEGSGVLLRWQNGAAGEGFGPRQGLGAWNETGVAASTGPGTATAMQGVETALQQRSGPGAGDGIGEPVGPERAGRPQRRLSLCG